MKTRKFGVLSIFAGLLMAHTGLSSAFTVDTSTVNGSVTGLWNNANESGWGGTVTQQFNTIFATFYTYEGNGTPVWYVASNCAVAGNGCTGDLYKVTGGSTLTSPWNGANKAVTTVGNVTFAFSDANTGTVNYTINGVSGTKSIAKSIFNSSPLGSLVATSTVVTIAYNQGDRTTLDKQCVTEFGVNAKVGDWEDIQKYYISGYSLDDLAARLGLNGTTDDLKSRSGLWLRYTGKNYNGSNYENQYYLSLDNKFIPYYLGSAVNIQLAASSGTRRVLCKI